jgi:hypothetical protein
VVIALEGPEAVEQVIVDNGHTEANGVSDVFVEAEFFFEQPGKTKIYKGADETYNAKFNEFIEPFHWVNIGRRGLRNAGKENIFITLQQKRSNLYKHCINGRR